ncbi:MULTISPECIES: hypothetical protein [Allobacillus]|uniref:DUF4293 family protein n=1 Tax=Allobacillus salarius TaxID=1955272 RepID=A0A556P9X6_9BACI|nr:hypothetical protein [Allobacillus salarius]TSJ61176.1 hypothetical protein FPQ13_11410 [Allobacillus salarius]
MNKQSVAIYIGLLAIINLCYFAPEIYKTNIRDEWVNNQSSAESYFGSLSQLNSFTLMIEITLIGMILAVSIWFIYKKQQRNLTGFLTINLIVSFIMVAVGLIIAATLNAAWGNFIQHQIGPIALTIALFLYQGIILLLNRWKSVMG